MNRKVQCGHGLDWAQLTWSSDRCLTSHRSIVSTWQTVNTCGGRSYMRRAALLHLETNCPAGFTMEGNRNVNFAEPTNRQDKWFGWKVLTLMFLSVSSFLFVLFLNTFLMLKQTVGQSHFKIKCLISTCMSTIVCMFIWLSAGSSILEDMVRNYWEISIAGREVSLWMKHHG